LSRTFKHIIPLAREDREDPYYADAYELAITAWRSRRAIPS